MKQRRMANLASLLLVVVLTGVVLQKSRAENDEGAAQRSHEADSSSKPLDEQERREVLTDTLERRQDCGYNLLSRIASINHCDRCPKTKSRLVMAANYLQVAAQSEANREIADRYDTAQLLLLSQCMSNVQERETATAEVVVDTEAFLAAHSSVSQLDMLEALPKETLFKFKRASDDAGEEGELPPPPPACP